MVEVYIRNLPLHTMPLNIKNKEAEEMIYKLAKETGDSLTGAVTSAVKDALARLEDKRAKKAEQIKKLCTKFQLSLHEPLSSEDADSLLYDRLGLPK